MAIKKSAPRKAASSSRPTAKAQPTPGRAPATPTEPIELPNGMWEQIARKAYALWEQRGRREGHDLEDWFDAETQVMEEMHEARE